jgi:hypothetical protein
MPTRSGADLILSAVLVALSLPHLAQAASEDFGQLSVTREHIKWPSPASVIRDLRSPDEGVRFNALLLLGVPDKLARISLWSSTTPSVVTGSEVVKPEQIELRYAALGSDETQQAIVAVQIVGSYAFAAVATPKGNGWERIAALNCWCKYDADGVTDTFVSLALAPDFRGAGHQRFELIVRASGGGSGIYGQDEAHFRLYRGELKSVMSFVSRVQSTSQGHPPPFSLRIERRWFNSSVLVNVSNGRSEQLAVLAESHAEIAVPHTVYFSIRELQDRFLKGITCRTFRWNQKLFQYEPVSAPNACQAIRR